MNSKRNRLVIPFITLICALLSGCPNGSMNGDQFRRTLRSKASQEDPEMQRQIEVATDNYTSIDPNTIIEPYVLPVEPCDNTDATAVDTTTELSIQTKEQWGGRPVERDPSFKCMDYQSMSSLMGFPTNLSEDALLQRVYQGGRILIHHAANNMSAREVQDSHVESRNLQDMAYHYFITTSGQIQEGRPLTLMGAHAGTLHSDHYTCDGGDKVAKINKDYDFRSIGIVLQGNFEEFETPEAQYQALKQLVSSLSSKYNIQKMNGHNHYRVGGTACPGKHLFERLQNDSDISLESEIDKTTNSLGPDFTCVYPSSSCS